MIFGAKLRKIKVNNFGKIHHIEVYDCSMDAKERKAVLPVIRKTKPRRKLVKE